MSAEAKIFKENNSDQGNEICVSEYAMTDRRRGS